MQRVLLKQGKRLIKSRRHRALYTIMRGPEVDNETDFLDVVETWTVTRDEATAREIRDAECKVRMQLVEAALKKLDE